VNQYAFAIVAIWGKAFIPAATEAWGLMRSRCFDAVLNDALIGGVLAIAQIVCGLLTGIVTALIAYYSFETDHWRAYAGLGFVIGVMLMTVVCEVFEAAVITLFICFADGPVTLQRTKPNEYNKLVRHTTCGPAIVHHAVGTGGESWLTHRSMFSSFACVCSVQMDPLQKTYPNAVRGPICGSHA